MGEQFEIIPAIIDLDPIDQDKIFQIPRLARALKDKDIPKAVEIGFELLYGVPDEPVDPRTREAVSRMLKVIGEYQNRIASKKNQHPTGKGGAGL